MAADLKEIYGVTALDEVERALVAFAEKKVLNILVLSNHSNMIGKICSFFSYLGDIRKAMYTIQTIDLLNMSLRKVIKNKRIFP